MRTQNITPDDIVLAEDVLQQTYYLGRVDYWLIGRKHSWRYQQRVDGRIQDFYTATAVIDSGEQLPGAAGRESAPPHIRHRQRREFARRASRDARRRNQQHAEVRPLRATVRWQRQLHERVAGEATCQAAGGGAVGPRPRRRNPDNSRNVGKRCASSSSHWSCS